MEKTKHTRLSKHVDAKLCGNTYIRIVNVDKYVIKTPSITSINRMITF